METQDSIRAQLTVQYDGSAFHGWQLQPELRTVQGELESALSRLADRPRSVIGSGRTDTGVHATGQVAAVDMPSTWEPDGLRKSLNAVLPPDIWISAVRRVRPDFHPRYHAVARSYRYRIGCAPESASPFHRRWCWSLDEELPLEALSRSAEAIVGEHSFVRFAKAGQPHRGERCAVAEAGWDRWGLGVELSITANRYLHHMVRYLVGTMVDVARGRRPSEDILGLLGSKEGLTTSPPAPAGGLFLSEVEYPEHVYEIDLDEHPRSAATA